MTDESTIRFTTTRAELTRAMRAINGARPAIAIMRRISWVAVVVTVALVVGRVIDPLSSIVFLFIPGLVLFLFWYIPLYLARMFWSKSPVLNSEQRWAVTERGISVVAGGVETQTAWGAITRAEETPEFVLLFGSSQGARYIPKRALSAQQLIELLRIAERSAGKGGVAELAPSERAAPIVEAAYEIDPGEAARAGVIAARKTGSLWISYAVVAAIVAWNTVPSAYAQLKRGGLAGVSIPMLLLGLAPLAMILVAPPLMGRWAAKRYARTAPSARGTQRVGVADWGLHVAGPLYSGAIEWPALMRVDETADFFLFYLGKLQPVFIPKRVLSVSAIDQVRAATRSGVGDKANLLSTSAH